MKSKRISPRRLIQMHCKRCSADATEPGNWRQQIGLCGVHDCDLWSLRAMPTARNPVTRQLAIYFGVSEDDPALIDLKSRGLFLEDSRGPRNAPSGASSPDNDT
jgi:hypothetical protein